MENMTDDEINELAERAKKGDNDAWNRLHARFEKYIHGCAWERMEGLWSVRKDELEAELVQAGWVGFARALKRYVPGKASLLTYAAADISREMSDQLSFEFNTSGVKDKPESIKYRRVFDSGSPGDEEAYNRAVSKASEASDTGMTIEEPMDHAAFGQARRVLQILKVLKQLTDEDHSLSKSELQKELHYYRMGKYGNDSTLSKKGGVYELNSADNTYTSDLTELLIELDPLKYTGENDEDYRIRYSGYRDDLLYRKLNKEEGRKAEAITGFSYTHDFDRESLDRLIQFVSFSDMFSNEEKARLIIWRSI